jgi:hypothetical protein
MAKQNKNIRFTDDGVQMSFGKTLPGDIPKGHRPHKSGAGIHADKRQKHVRQRGNLAKRMWLDE